MTDIEIGSIKHTGELTKDFLQSMQEHGYPVWYRWMFVTVQYNFVDGAIADLKRRGRAARKQLIKQVEQSLDSFF